MNRCNIRLGFTQAGLLLGLLVGGLACGSMEDQGSNAISAANPAPVYLGMEDLVLEDDVASAIRDQLLAAGLSQENLQGLQVKRVHGMREILENASAMYGPLEEPELIERVLANMDPLERRLYMTYRVEIPGVPPGDLHVFLQGLAGSRYVERGSGPKLSLVPNDTEYTNNKMWGMKAINMEQAWDVSQGQGVVVAVIDSGIYADHPDLKANLWAGPNNTHGYDFARDDSIPEDEMDTGAGRSHGTHCAGTIAAVGNNNTGVIGVAPKARIMALKVFYMKTGDDGKRKPDAKDEDIAQALRWAVDHGARVISNSYNWTITTADDQPPGAMVYEAIDYAYSRGATVVFSAGNSSQDHVDMPAESTRVIAVAAAGVDHKRTEFTNYGRGITLAAPGIGILSTVLPPFPNVPTFNIYANKDGTSMAAPHVAGVAALLLSANPTMTPAQVKQRLTSSAQPPKDTGLGAGLVDAYKALTGNGVPYPDLRGHWAEREIRYMIDNGYLAGFPDGTYGPGRNVTRAEFATMVVNVLNPAPVAGCAGRNFSDIANHWAQQNVLKAARACFIAGHPDGTFHPDDPVTKMEVLVALSSGLSLSGGVVANLPNYYSDAHLVPTWAQQGVANSTKAGLVYNNPDVKRLDPNVSTNRGTAGAIFYAVVARKKGFTPSPNSYRVVP